MRTFFDDLICASNDTTPEESGSVEAMVEEYVRSPCLPQESDPLAFWKAPENNARFSQMAKLASNYLCIPASSAPVERLFSITGKVFCPDRCRLNDELFQELMFIKCNN